VYLPLVSAWWCAAASALVVWWLARWQTVDGWKRGLAARWRARRGGDESVAIEPLVQPAWHRAARWSATLIVAAWFVAAWLTPALPGGVAARLDTLDVGDGTCHLLRVRDDKTGEVHAALFDCGSLRLTVGERDIPAAVRALGVRRVPTIVLSHPNIDHYSGVLDVLTPLGVRRVIVGEGFVRAAEASPTGAAAYVLRELERRGVELRTVAAGDDLGDERGAGRGTDLGFARVISPARGATFRADNDMSLMLRVEAGGADASRVVMLTGDAGREALADLMEREPSLRADVIEAPHHGSHNEVAEAFVRGLSPRVVVQSTGPRRLDDPRWAEVRAQTLWLATPRYGAVSVTVYEDGEITTRAWRRE
jgi:competence protein ComEC